MTVTEAVDFVRNRHNAASDTFWSDAEIYKLIEGRCQEIESIVGLIEATDTSITSTSGTSAYDFPTNFEFIVKLLYDGEPLQQMDFYQWDIRKQSGITPTGTPVHYVIWNHQFILVPTPDTSAIAITVYGEKRQPAITGASDTIDIPAVLHFRMLDGVLADMYSKDLELSSIARIYEEKWLNVHIPAFYKYKAKYRRRSRFVVIRDTETSLETDFGVV